MSVRCDSRSGRHIPTWQPEWTRAAGSGGRAGVGVGGARCGELRRALACASGFGASLRDDSSSLSGAGSHTPTCARSPRDRSGGRRASARGRSEEVRVCSLSSAVTGVTSADPRQRLACAARCKRQAGHNLGAGVEEAASGKLFLPPPSVSGNHPGLWPLVGSRRSTREPESFHLNFKSLTLPRQMRANKTSARRGF